MVPRTGFAGFDPQEEISWQSSTSTLKSRFAKFIPENGFGGTTFSCRERIKAAGGVFQRQRFLIMPAKQDFIESEPVTFDIRECGQLVKYDVVSIDSYMRAKNWT